MPKKEIFMEMDHRDQQQIVAAATGEVVEELVYEVHGRPCISWQGINHICYFMGDIKVEPWVEWEKIEMHGQTFWSATVRAVNERYNLASLGTAEMPEMMEVYDRDERRQRIPDGEGGFKSHLEPDLHCRRKAISMAQRNAKRAVIPAAVLGKWLSYFLDLKKGEKAEPPFRPKVVESEVKIVSPPKTKKKEPSKRPKNREPNKREQIPLTQGKVNLNIIEYNLRAINPQILDLVDIIEYADGFSIEPKTELDEEAKNFIDATIRGLGGEWEEKEPGRWRIPREG